MWRRPPVASTIANGRKPTSAPPASPKGYAFHVPRSALTLLTGNRRTAECRTWVPWLRQLAPCCDYAWELRSGGAASDTFFLFLDLIRR